jgi:8-oxo-dGTP pyrophosphatase MutT (NUDIX family)
MVRRPVHPRSNSAPTATVPAVDAAPLIDRDDPLLAATDDLAFASTYIEAAGRVPSLADTAREMLAFIDAHPDALHRACEEGHLTGSALVIDALAERTLVLFHTKLRKWLQPGGHADGDANLAAVALREAEEETGIEGLRVLPRPIDLDIHRVEPPWEAAHLHHDVRFLVVAPAAAVEVGNHESIELRWSREYELLELGADRSLQRLARCGFELARSLAIGPSTSLRLETVERARTTALAIVTERTHPYSGAMAIWADVRDHDGEGYAELREFIGLAAEWQLSELLRPVIEEAIRQAAENLIAG